MPFQLADAVGNEKTHTSLPYERNNRNGTVEGDAPDPRLQRGLVEMAKQNDEGCH